MYKYCMCCQLVTTIMGVASLRCRDIPLILIQKTYIIISDTYGDFLKLLTYFTSTLNNHGVYAITRHGKR